MSIQEILDTYAEQYYQLLRMPTIEAKYIKDKKRAEAKQALYKDMLELIGEDEKFRNIYQWEQDEPLNLLRQELRTKLKEYFGETHGR